MTPAARIQAAVEVLAALEQTAQPADKMLREWFRVRRYAGSKDRAAVAERVYDVLRHRASYAWRMGHGDARSLVIASLAGEGQSLDATEEIFSGTAYGPPPLTQDERERLTNVPQGQPPRHVQGEYPEWLEPELERAFGSALLEEMTAFASRAPVDLRVNTLRATREAMLTGLASLGIDARATPFSPHGLRIASAEGSGALQHTQFFQTGAFEFQDEASQIAALLCDAKPGQCVLDFAAGAGGKSLALAAQMANRGAVLAYDPEPTRLKEIGPRARRAGATIIAATSRRDDPRWGDGAFDIVLVDAPCSGSGTWRRNPELKWRLTSARLKELTELQRRILNEAATRVAPGGRLVYATCSLFLVENEDVIAAFIARNPKFRIVPARQIWPEVASASPPLGMGEYFHASPHKCATDGFFVCIMTSL